MIRLAKITLAALVIFAAACTKQEETVVPENPANPEKPASPIQAVDTSGFTQQPTGVSFQQVNNPKGITGYVLQIPRTYNQDKTKKWPLIIFLHGVGERGTDLNKVKRAGLAAIAAKNPDFPFIVISPQCPLNTWWNVPSLNAMFDDVIKRYNIDPSRVYLTGLSMGGFGTWDWGVMSPAKFAAIVPICGQGRTNMACSLKPIPTWAFHNADDPTVNVSGSRNMVKAIRDCGGTLVKYTENPTGGHDSWTKAYNDPALFTWLNAQRKK